MLRHSSQRHTTLLHSQLIDDDGTWVRKIIIYKAHKCLLRSWTQDTHCQTGWRGATTHSSHELSSQSAQIPDLESDSDSDLDSASDALCQLRRGRWNYDNAGGCLAMMGRSWGEAGNSGGLGWQLRPVSCSVVVRVWPCQRVPSPNLHWNWACVGRASACVFGIWRFIYPKLRLSLRLFPRPSLPAPVLCLSVHLGDLLNTRKVP